MKKCNNDIVFIKLNGVFLFLLHAQNLQQIGLIVKNRQATGQELITI